MSGNEGNAEDIPAAEAKVCDTENIAPGESLASEEAVRCAEEEMLLPNASVGGSGAEEESLASDVGGGSIEEMPLAGTVGGCGEVSTESEKVTKAMVVIAMEDLQKALLRVAKYQLGQFQNIKDDLVETIKDLKELSRRNPGNWEAFERLRENIKGANKFLDEINEAMIVQESREHYMSVQINEFFEKRGELLGNATFNLGAMENTSVEIQTTSSSSNAQKEEGPSAGETFNASHLAFFDRMMYAARFRSSMGEKEETKDVQVSVDMEAAGGPAEEPERIEVEGANESEDRDEEGRLLRPPVIGKYTLAVKAHELYPESSSEDSPEECLPVGAEGGSPRHMQQRNIGDGEDAPAQDPSHDNCPSDTSNDEPRNPYGL